tara:strand:- start:524 stop:1048 length:525 start_codon:yes stop_codon:yes gene_type:complete
MNKSQCCLSECRQYRWILEFQISNNHKEVIFIGLNPSLSDNKFIDNTTKKIIKISSFHKYGKIKIINLFALISKNPENLKTHKDPIGFYNDLYIKSSLRYWSGNIDCDLWLGWGNKGILFSRNEQVLKILAKYKNFKKQQFLNSYEPLIIRKTKSNNPIHPLYCLDNSKLIKYN